MQVLRSYSRHPGSEILGWALALAENLDVGYNLRNSTHGVNIRGSQAGLIIANICY